MLQSYLKIIFIKSFMVHNFSRHFQTQLVRVFLKSNFFLFAPSVLNRFFLLQCFHSSLYCFYFFNIFFFLKKLSIQFFLNINEAVLFDFFSRYRLFHSHLVLLDIMKYLQSDLFYLVINGSKRNSFVTFTNLSGRVIKSFSCGQERDFKKSKKKMWYAHLRLAERVYHYVIKYKSIRFVVLRILNFKYQCRSILKFLIKSFYENKY